MADTIASSGTELPHEDQLKRLAAVLDDRSLGVSALDSYFDGEHPLPPLVQEAKLTKAYRALMGLTTSNWPELIVSAANDRLEVQGVRFGDKAADADVTEIWQENGLDDSSSILHESALTDGRAFAIVWGNGDTRNVRPRITLEHASLCCIEYAAGTRERLAALRRWHEDGRWYATL